MCSTLGVYVLAAKDGLLSITVKNAGTCTFYYVLKYDIFHITVHHTHDSLTRDFWVALESFSARQTQLCDAYASVPCGIRRLKHALAAAF